MIVLDLKPLVREVSDKILEQLSQKNPDTRFETNSHGQLIIMSPTGSETGDFNLELAFQIKLWNKQTKLGKVFDSSTGFKLSNGAVRSPDVTWIEIKKWNSLTKEQRKTLAPVDPDFVIELLFPSDNLSDLQLKMVEYMNCGVKLGWLINPEDKQVEIYSQQQKPEILNNPIILSGENVLPGLIVDLREIF